MRKCTIIATCLVNSNIFNSLSEAEMGVKKIFVEEFPDWNFDKWNEHLHQDQANNIISAVGRASRINIHNFILDLTPDDQWGHYEKK